MNHFCKIYLLFNESFWVDKDYMYLVPKLRGWYMIWQNLYKFFWEKGKNMLMSTLAGDRCIDSLRKTDDEVKLKPTKCWKRFIPVLPCQQVCFSDHLWKKIVWSAIFLSTGIGEKITFLMMLEAFIVSPVVEWFIENLCFLLEFLPKIDWNSSSLLTSHAQTTQIPITCGLIFWCL